MAVFQDTEKKGDFKSLCDIHRGISPEAAPGKHHIPVSSWFSSKALTFGDD
jgi:hypothetical protein